MFLKISQISQENTCVGHTSLFNKVAELRAVSFIKKKFQRNCFPVKFAKFLRTPTFKNIGERLLLYLHVIFYTMHEKDLHEKIQLAMRD